MICKNCGREIEDDSKFCLACGVAIENPEKTGHRRRRKKKKTKLIVISAILAVAAAASAATAYIMMTNSGGSINDISVPAMNLLSPEPTAEVTAEPTQAPTPTPTSTPTPAPAKKRGTWELIPADVRESMTGISYTKNKHITLDDLAYLAIPHYDFEGNTVMGHMVVDKDLAEEVLDIFSELYEIKYPIENMELIDKYDALQTDELDSLDRSSMGRNNTSAFCYRNVSGTSTLSDHALGRAIDLNPMTNPWVGGSGAVSPRNAKKYAKSRTIYKADMTDWREADKKAFIGKDTEVYRIFIKHGWKWGGEWSSQNDYQHFYKP